MLSKPLLTTTLPSSSLLLLNAQRSTPVTPRDTRKKHSYLGHSFPFVLKSNINQTVYTSMANSQGPPKGKTDSGVHFHCTGCTFYLTTAGPSHGQQQYQPQQGLSARSAPAQPAAHTNPNQQHNTHAPVQPANATPQTWDQEWQNPLPESESQQPPFAPITDEEFNTWLQSLPNFDIGRPDHPNEVITQPQTSQAAQPPAGAYFMQPSR